LAEALQHDTLQHSVLDLRLRDLLFVIAFSDRAIWHHRNVAVTPTCLSFRVAVGNKATDAELLSNLCLVRSLSLCPPAEAIEAA
jgi:hypothetical protein